MRSRLRQNEGLAGQPTVKPLRRSPRLSSRLPTGSATPNPGQSVPVSFEDTEEVTVSRTRVGSSQREGMPRHSYEPAREWDVYVEERVIQTPPVIHGYSRVNETGFFGEFFTSLLFKLGSFLHLAVTAIILRLDVRRLFNFASISQRTGSISRYFFLVIALCTLAGFLIGGQFFPVETPLPTPPDYSAFKDRLVQDVMSQVEENFRVFEANYRRELDSTVDSLNRASKLSFTLREEMSAEVERIYKALTEDERHSSEVRKSLEGRFSELSSQLEMDRKLLAAQIEELKEGQAHLVEKVDKNLILKLAIGVFVLGALVLCLRSFMKSKYISKRAPFLLFIKK